MFVLADYVERYSDKASDKLEKQIRQVYKQAAEEVQKKLDDFIRRHKARNAQMLQMVADGKMSKQDYQRWMRGQVFQGDQWKQKLKDVTDVYVHADEKAREIVGGTSKNVFMEAANYTAYDLEKGMRGAVAFNVYDAKTVERLLKKDPKMLPEWKIDQPKDYKWNEKRVRNAVAQGIIQGESVEEVGDRLTGELATSNATKMDMFARTAINGAQNAGRMDRLHEAEEMGIEVRKKWLATLDQRTRDTHQALDGQEQPVDEPFVVDGMKIDYPGDPFAPPELVYNCRCTLTYVYPKYQHLQHNHERRDQLNDKNIENMTYREWEEMKRGKQSEPIDIPEPQREELPREYIEFDDTEDALDYYIDNGESWVETLTEEEKRAVSDYGYNYLSAECNGYLRGETDKYSDYQLDAIKEQIRKLDQAIEKGAIPDDMRLYRGVGRDYLGIDFSNPEALIGKTVKEGGFMSVSGESKVAETYGRGVVLDMHVPKGTHTAYVDLVQSTGSELREYYQEDGDAGNIEYLLERGGRLKFTGYKYEKDENGKEYVRMFCEFVHKVDEIVSEETDRRPEKLESKDEPKPTEEAMPDLPTQPSNPSESKDASFVETEEKEKVKCPYTDEMSSKGYVGLSAAESDEFIKNHHNKRIVGKKGSNTMDGSQSRRINTAFRNDETPTNPADVKLVQKLDAEINKNELPQDMTLFRGVSLDAFSASGVFDGFEKTIVEMSDFKDASGNIDFDKWGKAYEEATDKDLEDKLSRAKKLIGTTIEDKGYMQVSASSQRNIFAASEIGLQIHAPKGTNAYISDYQGESEIILGRGTSYRVLDATIATTTLQNGNQIKNIQLIVETVDETENEQKSNNTPDKSVEQKPEKSQEEQKSVDVTDEIRKQVSKSTASDDWFEYDYAKAMSEYIKTGEMPTRTLFTFEDLSQGIRRKLAAEAELIQETAEKTKTEYKTTYRGMVLSEEDVKALKTGSKHTFDTLTASTPDKKLASVYTDVGNNPVENGVPVVFEIQKPDGIYAFDREKGTELVLPRGSTFRIERKYTDEDGVVHISLYSKKGNNIVDMDADQPAEEPQKKEKEEPKRTEETKEESYQYHATTAKAIIGIAEKGLQPNRGHVGKGIYFADSAKDALDWVDTTSTGGKTVLRVSEEYLEKEKLEKYSASETGYGLAESLYDGKIPLEHIQIKVNDNGDEDDWWSLAQYLKNRKYQYNMLDQKTKKKVDKLVDEEDERRLKRRR